MIIDTDQYYTLKDFSAKIGEDSNMIRPYIKDGRVESVKFGRIVYIKKDELQKWPPKHFRPGPQKKITQEATNG